MDKVMLIIVVRLKIYPRKIKIKIPLKNISKSYISAEIRRNLTYQLDKINYDYLDFELKGILLSFHFKNLIKLKNYKSLKLWFSDKIRINKSMKNVIDEIKDEISTSNRLYDKFMIVLE